MGIQVAMLQGKELPSNRAYLDNCSTLTAFKMPSISVTSRPKKGNAGELQRWDHKNKPKWEYGRVEAWYMPKGIENIFSMNDIEKLHHITYDSIDGYCVVHTDKGPVYFHKDKQGLH